MLCNEEHMEITESALVHGFQGVNLDRSHALVTSALPVISNMLFITQSHIEKCYLILILKVFVALPSTNNSTETSPRPRSDERSRRSI
jgi:hypothetical protein